ncbi:MAG: CDP-glycerol glycerophosphotransferase family protein [Magnetococcales bacterium]|nr:CDP-glycerol glycerophosphotransferase family protein [Magnetococcales bacterium]
MERPTIFFIVNYGGAAVRNILHGGVLEELINRGYRVVLFSLPEHNRKAAEKLFGDQIVVESFDDFRFRGLQKMVQRIRTYHWRTLVPYDVLLQIQRKTRTFKNNLQDILGHLVSGIPFSWWEKILNSGVNWPEGEELFDKYQPVAVLISNPTERENVAINYARSKGIYTACILESWDNLCMRGALYSCPDDMLVWNELVATEARELHFYPKERVHATGIPSFDLYANKDGKIPTEEMWRKEMGIAPDAPIILYTTAAPQIYSQADGIVASLLKAREDGRLPENTHILIRLHPLDNFQQYDIYKDLPGFTIQYPSATFKDDSRNDSSLGKPLMLAATLTHSTVVLNVFSTIIIEALANDTPVIGIAYDVEPVPANRSVSNYLLVPTIRELVKLGGVPVVRNEEELIREIRNFIDDGSYLLKQRVFSKEQEIYNLDGTATLEIAKFVHNRIQQQ